MLKVCLCYEEEYQYPMNGAPASVDHWDVLFNIFQPDKIYVVNLPEESPWLMHKYVRSLGDNFVRLNSYDDIPDSEHLVFLSPPNARNIQGITNLKDYTHPEDCVYVYGPDCADLNCSKTGDKIYIESKSDQQFFAWYAAAITFYDRQVKNGG